MSFIPVGGVGLAAGVFKAAPLSAKGEFKSFIRLDVRRESEWQQVIATVMQRHGRLDILVNNDEVTELHTPETIMEEPYRSVPLALRIFEEYAQ